MNAVHVIKLKESIESDLRVYELNRERLYKQNGWISVLRFFLYSALQILFAIIAVSLIFIRFLIYKKSDVSFFNRGWLFVNFEDASRANHVKALLKNDTKSVALISPMGRKLDNVFYRNFSTSLIAKIGFPFTCGFAVWCRLVSFLIDVYADHNAVLSRCRLGYSLGLWYRLAFGFVQSDYIVRLNSRDLPKFVLFGHAGLADSFLISDALRVRGVRSVHFLHGLDRHGIMRSNTSIDICMCGFDSVSTFLHSGQEKVGLFFPLPMPTYIRSVKFDSIHVCSNLLHPGSRDTRIFLDGFESKFISLIQGLASGLHVIWRPHPSIRFLPEFEQRSFFSTCESSGFTIDQDKTLAPKAGVIYICSLSTIALGLLAGGALPIIYDPMKLAAGTVYSSFPYVASDGAQMNEFLQLMRDATDSMNSDLFCRTWNTCQPGTVLKSFDQLHKLL